MVANTYDLDKGSEVTFPSSRIQPATNAAIDVYIITFTLFVV